MKKQFVLKLILLFVLIITFRLIQCQSPLDTIDWVYQQKESCTSLKEKLKIIDTSATSNTMVEACRCALKLKDGQLALEYIAQAEEKHYNNHIVINILKGRIYSLLKEDQKALSILKDLSTKIEIMKVMEISEIKELSKRNAEAMSMYHNSRPTLDYFTFTIAVICILGYFVGVLFLIKSVQSKPLVWLSIFVINFSIIMTSYVLYWTKFNWNFPFLNEWWHPLYLLIGPIFYLYLKSVIGDRNSIASIFMHFCPFILCTLIFGLNGLFFQLAYSPTNLGFLLSILQSMPFKLISLALYFVLSTYLIKGDWMVDPYVKKWMLYIFIFFAIFILANLVYYTCTFWEGFNKDWDYGISAVMSIGIIGVATVGFLESKYLSFQPSFTSNPKPKEYVKATIDVLPDEIPDITFKKYKSSTLTSSASTSVKSKLEKLMTEKRIFQREDLRLQDVADLIGLHRNQVSQVINENYNLNFFEWINRYRIHHAADLLSTPNCPYTISQVGFESGFNNKVSFYKSFRQYFQCTPLEYVASLERERAKMS